MASWTDSKQIPFSPYVQQLPVEAMVNVGMQKQGLYNQGLQRIQSQIDSVAGLDIMKDVDKAYLQSKMNSLGDNLKLVAAGDFSDFQLTNSVGGMVNQVGKDKNIQNAVSSTMNHQKQMISMEEAKSKGEWGIENEDDYLKNLNNYMSSNKVGEKFTSTYTPYTDINQRLFDIAKAVGVDESIIPELFQTDDNGVILRNEKGLPIFNPVMAEKHLKGKDPAKLLNAFKTALTPTDYNQLSITGRYRNKGKDPDTLAQEVISSYSSDIASYKANVNDLNIKLITEKSRKEINPEKIKSIEDQISYYKSYSEKLKSTIEKDASDAYQNPEAARGRLYANNYISGMSKSLSEVSESTTYSVNPHHTVSMDLRNFGLRQQQFERSEFWKQKEFDRNEFWKMKEFAEKNTTFPTEGFDKPLDITGMGAMDMINMKQDEFNAGVDELYETNRTIALEWYKKLPDAPKRKDGQTNDSYEEELMKAIYTDAKAKGLDPTVGSDDMYSYLSDFAARQVSQWITSPSDDGIYQFEGIMKKRDKLTKDLLVERAIMEGRHQEALNQAEIEGVDVKSYEAIQNNITEVDVPVKGGKVHLTKSDIYNIYKANPSKFNVFGKLSESKQQSRDEDIAREGLQRKFGKNLITIENYLFPIQEGMYGETRLTRHSSLLNLDKALNTPGFERVPEIEAELYKKAGDLERGKIYSVKKGKTDERDYTGEVVNAIRAMGGLTGMEDSNSEDLLRKAIDGASSISIDVDPSSEGMNYTLVVTDEDGTEHKGKTTPEVFTRFTGNAPLQKLQKPKVLEMIDYWGTTSEDGQFDPETAWFNNNSFTKLQGSEYRAVGNLIQDPSDSNNLIFEMYINGSDTPIQPRVPISKYAIDRNGNIIPGVYNPQLDNISEAITPVDIENFLNK